MVSGQHFSQTVVSSYESQHLGPGSAVQMIWVKCLTNSISCPINSKCHLVLILYLMMTPCFLSECFSLQIHSLLQQCPNQKRLGCRGKSSRRLPGCDPQLMIPVVDFWSFVTLRGETAAKNKTKTFSPTDGEKEENKRHGWLRRLCRIFPNYLWTGSDDLIYIYSRDTYLSSCSFGWMFNI